MEEIFELEGFPPVSIEDIPPISLSDSHSRLGILDRLISVNKELQLW
jgi:hypothetical protein